MKDKEHRAFWNGFKVAMETVESVLSKDEFDFTGCTNTDQITKLVFKKIKNKIKQCTCEDHN